jgi:REP element-mobilizing transposase RayT
MQVHKSRLTRLSLLYITQPLYFVTACTADRKAILANDRIHDAFVAFARQGIERGAYVGRYVIMPDHIHFFVAFEPDVMTLSDWMKSLKNSLSKTLRLQGVAAPHWQKGFFDHVLRSEESYFQKWQYEMNNPVEAGLVKSPEEWPYQGEICELEARR